MHTLFHVRFRFGFSWSWPTKILALLVLLTADTCYSLYNEMGPPPAFVRVISRLRVVPTQRGADTLLRDAHRKDGPGQGQFFGPHRKGSGKPDALAVKDVG
jgi:hypothetical protein